MVCLYPSERCSDLPKVCSLIWGSELPCWGVHAVGRWTLLLGVLRMLHLGFVPRGTKKLILGLCQVSGWALSVFGRRLACLTNLS
eukprot:CCRYP_015839-RA/>CCRYP_015839-RA protein AED:0.00 eAED:0.00 QI:12/1/0.5/1/0/0/2/0/84